MAELTDHEIDAALSRGREVLLHQPRAETVRYDTRTGHVVIALTNGCTFSFPARLAEGLEAASEAQLADVELLGAGSGLHWETLDVDLSVSGLMAGLLGTRAYMARLAGETKSPAKAAAARANGAKGGRKRKPVAV